MIADQHVATDRSTGALAFSFGDAVTTSDRYRSLAVGGFSSMRSPLAHGYRGFRSATGAVCGWAPRNVGLKWNATDLARFAYAREIRMTHRFDRVVGLLWRLRGCHRLVMTSFDRVDGHTWRLAATRTSHRGAMC